MRNKWIEARVIFCSKTARYHQNEMELTEKKDNGNQAKQKTI